MFIYNKHFRRVEFFFANVFRINQFFRNAKVGPEMNNLTCSCRSLFRRCLQVAVKQRHFWTFFWQHTQSYKIYLIEGNLIFTRPPCFNVGFIRYHSVDGVLHEMSESGHSQPGMYGQGRRRRRRRGDRDVGPPGQNLSGPSRDREYQQRERRVMQAQI